MRLGMMQPYFFPYVGYFSLIHATDSWVVFDTAQYMRRAWVNRNRVLCDGSEPWKYVRIPVVHVPRETSILETHIDQSQGWSESLIAQLQVYRLRRAPNYSTIVDWLQACLNEAAAECSDRLSDWLVHLLQATCLYIELPFHYQLFSQMALTLPSEMSPGDWALEVSKATGAATYVNAPGGQDLFCQKDFDTAGIRLQILQPQLTPYHQGRSEFIPGLSILDLLMWNSPAEVRQLVAAYSLEHASPLERP